MTRRKALRKKLAKLKYERQELIRWVDCSEVYGDGYFTKDDIIKLDKEIQEVEREYEREKSTERWNLLPTKFYGSESVDR